MGDYLVKLYDLPDVSGVLARLEKEGIRILRPKSFQKTFVLDFIRKRWHRNWADECDGCFSKLPINCFMAVKDKKVIGFSCYDTTMKGFFGPTGVCEKFRGIGIGKALCVKALEAMHHEGYGYAIIGGGIDGFYVKAVNAIPIEGSSPGVYDCKLEDEENIDLEDKRNA